MLTATRRFLVSSALSVPLLLGATAGQLAHADTPLLGPSTLAVYGDSPYGAADMAGNVRIGPGHVREDADAHHAVGHLASRLCESRTGNAGQAQCRGQRD